MADSVSRSNECEMFYIDSYFLDRYPEFVYSTLAHEFQHMLHFVHKTMINGVSSTTWFNEMLSMICEDLLSGSDYLNTSDEYSPKSRLTYFNAGYALLGLTEWSSDYTAYSYANAYAFGAWLTRNYGGAELVKSMASNEYVDLECILQAIYDCGGGTLTVAELLRQFTRSICYPELTNTQYTSAGGSCSSTNYLKPFCASDTHSITSSATGTSYEITLTPIQLSDYYYIIDNKYYITPYYYDAGYAYYLSNYGEVVIDLGATTSTKAYYITGSSSTKSYFVIQ